VSSDEMSQTFSVVSALPLTIRFPSGLKVTLVTAECPLSVSVSWPVWASQTFTVSSELPPTIRPVWEGVPDLSRVRPVGHRASEPHPASLGTDRDHRSAHCRRTYRAAGPVPNPGYRMYPSSHPRDPCGGTLSATSPDPLASVKATANGKRPLGAPRV